MKTETKTIAEYKAPRCKVVEVRVQRTLMDTSITNPFDGDTEEEDI